MSKKEVKEFLFAMGVLCVILFVILGARQVAIIVSGNRVKYLVETFISQDTTCAGKDLCLLLPTKDETLCFAKSAVIAWKVPADSKQVTISIQEPPAFLDGSNSTVGTFPAHATNLSKPGYGYTVWNVGKVVEDRAIMREGFGYRMILSDNKHTYTGDDKLFTVAKCN